MKETLSPIQRRTLALADTFGDEGVRPRDIAGNLPEDFTTWQGASRSASVLVGRKLLTRVGEDGTLHYRITLKGKRLLDRLDLADAEARA